MVVSLSQEYLFMKSKIVFQRFTRRQVTESKIVFIYKIECRRPVSFSMLSCIGVDALVTHSTRNFGCVCFRGHLQETFLGLECIQASVPLYSSLVRGLMHNHIFSLLSSPSSAYLASVWKMVMNFYAHKFSQCFGNICQVFDKLDIWE